LSTVLDDADPASNDLLTAVAIPLPEDADSDVDMDESTPISFSSPYEKYPPESQSRVESQSHASNGHQPGLNLSSGTDSHPPSVPQPIVEDALRARAEQAQNAAERLLELVEPEDPQPQASLLLNNGTASRTRKVQAPTLTAQIRTPSTPTNKSATVWNQAAAFRDSPAQQATPSLMTDVLRPTTTRVDGAWWRKRMARM
jgi:CLIP-associating protein 1/2